MKNIFKLSAFILLLCSFVFSATSIVSADEAKAESTAESGKAKEGEDKAKEDEGGDKKKKKKEEEPDCE